MRKILLVSLMVAITLMMVSSVMGALTDASCDLTETAGQYDGSRNDGTYGTVWFKTVNVTVNQSVALAAAKHNFSNCTMSVATRSSYDATANTSETIVTIGQRVWNNTAYSEMLWFLWNTSKGATVGAQYVEDGAYTATIVCYNDSYKAAEDIGKCTETISFYVDNTKPYGVTRQSSQPTSGSTDDDGDVTFIMNTDSANVTSCQLLFDNSGVVPLPSSYEIKDSTVSGNYSQEINDMANTGAGYEWYWICTDGINSSSYNLTTLYVDKPGGSLKNLAVAQAVNAAAGGRAGGISGSKAAVIGAIAAGAYLTLFKAGIILRKKLIGF